MKHESHTWMMIVGCGIPIILLIALPLFGITGNWLWGLAIGTMVLAHLFMMKGHATKQHGGD